MQHEPMNKSHLSKLGVNDVFHDLYIHKKNMDSVAPEGKTYFSMRLQR